MHTQSQQILVVDDEPIIRDMMVDMLEFEGYPIQLARHGREALDVLQHADTALHHLIFLDLMMPVMGGREFLRQLTAIPTLRQRQAIVLMSALDQLAQASDLDIDATMPKPFTIDDVLRIIKRYMGSP